MAKTLVELLEGIIRDAIPLRDVPRLLPRLRNGKHPHIATVYRWATVGVRGVTLATIQVGGTLCTTPAYLAEFLGRLNKDTSVRETPAPRERENRRAEQELDQIGI